MLLFLALACNETGVLHEYPIPTLAFELTSPTYAQFVGDGAVVVEGHTGSSLSRVWVEGQPVPVDEAGDFRVELPVDYPYRIIEVEASLYEQHAEARVPVFDGNDPATTWPGGMTMRLTQRGLDGLAGALAATVEGLISDDAVLGLIPEFEVIGWTFGPTGLTLDPVDVVVDASPDGIDAAITITDLEINVLLAGDIFGFPVEVPGTLRLPEVGVTVPVGAGVDETGAYLELGALDLTFDAPELELSRLDLAWLSDLLLGSLDLGQLLTDALGGAGLAGGTKIPLGSADALPLDLLGFQAELRLAELLTDEDGLGIGFAVGVGAPAPAEMPDVPYPSGAAVDLDVAVHEGLLQPLVQSDLLALLDTDLTLPGFLGIFLEGIVRTLPGGDQAPTDAAGWCVGLRPGDARVVRFREGNSPLIGVYLPDATVKFGYLEPGAEACTDWLVASMALEVGVAITDGTVIDLQLGAPEGKVLSYGAVDYDEDGVIQGLSGSLTSLLGLFGGLVQLDLAELLDLEALLGGLTDSLGVDLGELSLRIGDARPVLGDDGQPIDGLWAVGVAVFPE